MSQKHQSETRNQAYLSGIAKNSVMNQNRNTPNQSPSKLGNDRNLTNNSTLESSDKKIAAADEVHKASHRSIENAEEADHLRDV
jgi:hypothetical protein